MAIERIDKSGRMSQAVVHGDTVYLAELVADYREKFAHPYEAAARGFLDDVIDPRDTRPRLISALETLLTKRDAAPPKKHGNLPL